MESLYDVSNCKSYFENHFQRYGINGKNHNRRPFLLSENCLQIKKLAVDLHHQMIKKMRFVHTSVHHIHHHSEMKR